MRKNPHVRICGGLGSATTLVYPTLPGHQIAATQELSSDGAAIRRFVQRVNGT